MSGLAAVKRTGARLAEQQVEARRHEMVREAEALQDISARIEGEDVVFEGRGLLDRWIRDASIRNIGRTGR